jgi:mannose-6-phosphate isomerase-like protein (cupin superfamily)
MRSSPPETARAPFWFLGGRVETLVPGTATNRALSVLQFDDPQGQAPPLHLHEAEDELWVVLEGEVSFFVGDHRFDLQAGQVGYGPRGVPHSYLVRSPTARMAVVYTPAGIEEWFAANGSPVGTAQEAPAAFDLPAILAAADNARLHVLGPPPTEANGRSGV